MTKCEKESSLHKDASSCFNQKQINQRRTKIMTKWSFHAIEWWFCLMNFKCYTNLKETYSNIPFNSFQQIQHITNTKSHKMCASCASSVSRRKFVLRSKPEEGSCRYISYKTCLYPRIISRVLCVVGIRIFNFQFCCSTLYSNS